MLYCRSGRQPLFFMSLSSPYVKKPRPVQMIAKAINCTSSNGSPNSQMLRLREIDGDTYFFDASGYRAEIGEVIKLSHGDDAQYYQFTADGKPRQILVPPFHLDIAFKLRRIPDDDGAGK